jgi:ATP-dependent helicase/nuclease subunit B
MSRRLLLTGPTFPELEAEAFDILGDSVGQQPESVLYITQQDHPDDATQDRWEQFGPSAGLRIDTIDTLVTRIYEADQYKGRVTHVDRPLLSRLVEMGLETIESSTNPLHTDTRFPRAGLVQEAQKLFTELEFAGLLSPGAMRSRLEEEGVGDRAGHVEELAAAIEAARQELLADDLSETYRTERLHHVATNVASLTDIFPSVEAVVLGGFTRFDALEVDLLRRIVDSWPTISLLPKQTDSDTAPGVDAGAEQALRTYLDLGFDRQHHVEAGSGPIDDRRRLVRSLYRHPEQSPSTGTIGGTDLNVELVEPEAPTEEVRHVARDIRSRIASGTAPERIGVILTSPSQYTDQVHEVFETYGFPFSVETNLPFGETALGDVVTTVCQLAREPRTVDSVLGLLANPLVTVPGDGGELNLHELNRIAARTETTRLESTLEHADDPLRSAVKSLIRDIESLPNIPLQNLDEELDTLFDQLGVTTALEDDSELGESVRQREQAAGEHLDRVVESLSLTAPLADPEIGDTLDRLERALHGVSIRRSGRATEDDVTVCTLGESLSRSFDHAYVLGLTSAQFPSNPDRTAFTRPIYECHPDFEQTDHMAEARYHVGALLGSTASLSLSVPQRSVSGEPRVEADILTEIRRLVELSDAAVEATEDPPGTQEDVQRALGAAVPELGEERAGSLIAEASEAGTFSATQRTRIESGLACARARSSAELTPYDGQLSPETVSIVHGPDEREPYSPSRLETYAACGFKYYVSRVLGIEAPDPLTRDPDALARGSYIHDVLERYYLELQPSDGASVDPGGEFQTPQEQLLEIALDRLDSAFADYSRTSFHEDWLTSVLAGLGTASTNPYHGPSAESDSRPSARGLFYRFLEHEFDEPAKTTAKPTWFEARIGQPYDAGTPINADPAEVDTPQGPVSLHGLIDRIDTVPGTEPTQAVVRDYKTGSSTPGETDALLGLRYQLPLYALMAEESLDAVETVGGAYYQVSPPSSVSSRKGLLTSQDMTTYHGSDDVETPLLRHGYPSFETHDAFRQFIEETTTRRLGRMAGDITEGRFHPTVLDPSDAGCRYCDYAHVCDVRPHRRREVIEEIDESGIPVYVPPKARDHEVEDIVEVN